MTTSPETLTETTEPTVAGVLRSPSLLLATGLGSGLSPVAPGTVGSVPGLVLAWALLDVGGLGWLCAATLLLFAVGVWSATLAGKAWRKVDHGAIVIDEIVGQMLTVIIPVLILSGWTDAAVLYGLGFLAFRLFDIVKPWPANVLDRNSTSGWGVMMDDVAAGVMAGLLVTGVQVVVYLVA